MSDDDSACFVGRILLFHTLTRTLLLASILTIIYKNMNKIDFKEFHNIIILFVSSGFITSINLILISISILTLIILIDIYLIKKTKIDFLWTEIISWGGTSQILGFAGIALGYSINSTIMIKISLSLLIGGMLLVSLGVYQLRRKLGQLISLVNERYLGLIGVPIVGLIISIIITYYMMTLGCRHTGSG